MKRVIVIPDSFKGTMSSSEVCRTMESAIHEINSAIEVITIPVADGGEGSVEAFLKALRGEKVYCKVTGPFFEEMEAFYGRLEQDTAVVEMAACSGLPLVEGREDPMLTTTYGVGELMLDAIEKGAKKLIVGLGGSCTNDGGVGAAAALGARFYNTEGETFIPTGGTLKDIVRIDIETCREKLKGIEIITMCDIDNPLYGKQGAAYIFGPQKGADEKMVEVLDNGLRHLQEVIQNALKIDVSVLKGAGAAGGMGAGMVAFLGSKLQMGIETVLDVVGFEELLEGTDLVFTGEGKIDAQSLSGKVVMGVAKRAKSKGVPVMVLVGAIGEGIEPIYDEGVTAIFSINRAPIPFEEARYQSVENLYFMMKNVMKVIER
ncbi:glycerate kinase family protein [Niameybacter massiliensis]|uniref:glycerate kinase family protein n=1 Tax=Niameybacter massiliensis TaxID=1658108 RepID=UPI0006B61774|nr:glycerate kinase [Niameybacter massiliensis]